MKKIFEVISYIFISILLLIIIMMGIIFIESKTAPDMVPNLFGYKPFIVLSGSMETEIYKGDLVIVKVINYDELKKSDIIAYKASDGYVTTHRIVKIKNENNKRVYETKGDNNNQIDNEYITNDNIEGVYVTKVPGMGDTVLLLQRPVTLITILVILGLICVVFVYRDRSSLTDEEKEELEQLRKLKNKKK